jgi:uncharacterized membrane protein YebE (DUF533 family)
MLDRELRERIAEHERELAGQPADPHQLLAAAAAETDRAQAGLANMDAIAEHTRCQLGDLGRLAGLSRPPRR